MITNNIFRILAVLFLALLLSITGTIFLARNAKKAILGLESWEIAEILQQRNATFEATREGVARLTLMDASALLIKRLFNYWGSNRNNPM